MADNYFVCTLGQALHQPKTKATSIPDFLDLQANQYGQRPAVGFAGLAEKPTCVLTFYQLNEQTKDAARGLVHHAPQLKESLDQNRTAALLAHSDVDFLKTWLGLIRLGFSVLLLAPQLDKASIEHLCAERNVKYLFHDGPHASKASEVRGLELVCIQPELLSYGNKDDLEVESQISPGGKVATIPYLHHSSGTSSGKPKAIPQSSAAAFAALPSIDKYPGSATFSSTPLYHGGVADCFRSWTSGQMIWLFLGGEKPVTAQTVLACLAAAAKCASVGSIPPVKYFSSVPYVLRDLAANESGMDILRQMDTVGVGGAAFPTSLGQKLVDQGVNLVSRYGSAECGFLLSSNRNFDDDHDWDYLRSETGAEHLSFEPQDSGLFEVVVKPGWPHMAKMNREDGSYATADLLEKHPTKPNAWRYHSRADAQITLVNGKKFDPEPIESAMLSRCQTGLMLDALVFGDGESYPGALIFVAKSPGASPENLVNQVWPIIDDVNQRNPSHARLSKTMLKVIFHENERLPPLEKSSKGTIMRQKAQERYRDQMKLVYDEQQSGFDPDYSIRNESDLIAAIIRIVEATTGKNLAKHEDFFEQGIDSVACIQTRNAIQNLVTNIKQQTKYDRDSNTSKEIPQQLNGFLTPPLLHNVGELPTNLLYDCGTIEKVVEYLLGRLTPAQDDDLLLMKELVTKYSHFDIPAKPAGRPPTKKEKGFVVLLTGATGALGTHILDVLRQRPDVEQIFCLLRASDPFTARQRVDKALKSKAKDGLESIHSLDKKVVCIACNLAQQDLGVDQSMLMELKSTVDLVIHAAWAVNFTLKLKSFDFHLAGMQNLLNLGFAAARPSTTSSSAEMRPVKFVFCSSIASVSTSSGESIAEWISEDPSDASPMGYSRSKWAAESICVNAKRAAKAAGVALDVDVLRIGQLCGDTEQGIWNKTEAWPLMLSTFEVVGCLPDLPCEKLNWLPLNVAANAVCEITFNKTSKEHSRTEARIYHVLNPHADPTWAQMLRWLQEKEGGQLPVVESAAWLHLLEESLKKDYLDHPSRKLLGLWKDAYQSPDERRGVQPQFTIAVAAKISDTLASVKPVSPELIEKMWTWVRSSVRADK
jgi:thioester reductase-like protein